jgi:hypothetical protein
MWWPSRDRQFDFAAVYFQNVNTDAADRKRLADQGMAKKLKQREQLSSMTI